MFRGDKYVSLHLDNYSFPPFADVFRNGMVVLCTLVLKPVCTEVYSLKKQFFSECINYRDHLLQRFERRQLSNLNMFESERAD